MTGGKRGAVVAKQKWTDEEEAALRAGVEKYEVGKWRHIQKDSEFGPILKNRSNVDLKDKWRNLNMDSGGSRRDSRGGGGERSSAKRKRRKRQEPSETGGEEDDEDLEYVAGRIHASGKRRRVAPRRRFDEEPEITYPEPAHPSPEVAEENILAAMIQLQSPEGCAVDTICEWLEENYGAGAAVKRTVKWTLKQMMEAGRITSQGGLYKLSGFPQQIVEDSKRWADEEDGLPFSWGGANSRTAREAAEAAAKAVQEAEKANGLANELIAAADRYDRETPTDEPNPPRGHGTAEPELGDNPGHQDDPDYEGE